MFYFDLPVNPTIFTLLNFIISIQLYHFIISWPTVFPTQFRLACQKCGEKCSTLLLETNWLLYGLHRIRWIIIIPGVLFICCCCFSSRQDSWQECSFLVLHLCSIFYLLYRVKRLLVSLVILSLKLLGSKISDGNFPHNQYGNWILKWKK